MSQLEHLPVLLQPTIDALLSNQQHGFFVDATFGRGGHARALLSRLDADSRLFAFDKDPEALAVGLALAEQDPRLTMIHASFAELQSALAAHGVDQVDGIMADLGVSSPQLDQAGRGFSFMSDGPLDMRMDNSQGLSAAEWLLQVDESTLADVMYQYGEERYSRRIARAIKLAGEIKTTAELAEIVKVAHPRWEKHKHPATRAFQAIRIKINRELDDLVDFLPQTLAILKPKSRLAVISFHSLEDRLVKQFIQRESVPPANDDAAAWIQPQQAQSKLKLKKIARISANAEELKQNTRARSAWLRVAERTEIV